MIKSNVAPLCFVVLIFGCLTLGSARRDSSLVHVQSTAQLSPSESLPLAVHDSYTQSTPANSSYFTIRPDMRRCASPMCGGYFVKQVNSRTTRCADGTLAEQCYVAEIDWNKHPSIEPRNALLRAELTAKQFQNFGKLGVMRVWEVWEAVADAESTGMFYRVRDRKIRCIAFPCLTHNDVLLNSNVSTNIAGVDLKSVKAESNRVAEAMNALNQPDGLLVIGSHLKVKGQAGQANSLNVTQFYLRAKEQTSSKPCMKTGCSMQICSDEEVMSTCEYRMEYECYKKATCERQPDGNCGFTKTPELDSCITRMQKKSGN